MPQDPQRETTTDGAELVRRFRGGDQSAFAELHRRHRAVLARRIERELPERLRRRVAVSDVLQESLLTAFDCRSDLDESSERGFRAWLLTIADHKVLETIRHHEATQKRSARREVTRARRPETSAHAGREASPSQAAVGAEMHALAQHAMRRLPPDYREVLRLARQEGLPLAEVGARMGRSHEAVKKLYGRALVSFRREFERLGGDRP